MRKILLFLYFFSLPLKILGMTFDDHTSLKTCFMCNKDLQDPKNYFVKTVCGHVFHQQCLYSWLQDKQNKCPVCKTILFSDKDTNTEVRIYLYTYIQQGKLDDIDILINTFKSQGISILNVSDPLGYGLTPFMWAVACNQPEIVRCFIGYEVPLNTQDVYGNTALHWAIAKNVKPIFDFLLIQKTIQDNINKQDYAGYTPLCIAVLCENCSMVKSLLDSGADPSIKNRSGHTALDLAVKYDYKDIISVLSQNLAKKSC